MNKSFRFLLLVSLLGLLLVTVTHTAESIPALNVRVIDNSQETFYALHADTNEVRILLDEVKDFIYGTDHTLQMAFYGLGEPEIRDAVIDILEDGKTVELVGHCNYFNHHFYSDFYHSLRLAGLDIKIKGGDYTTCASSGLMHNKYLIRDHEDVLTGSMNFTPTGTSGNANTLLIFEGHPEIAQAYLNDFYEMWLHNRWGTAKQSNGVDCFDYIGGERVCIYFTPQEDLLLHQAVIDVIDNANEFYFATFILTSDQIGDALERLHDETNAVVGIMDSGWYSFEYSEGERLCDAGVEIAVEFNSFKRHTKHGLCMDCYDDEGRQSAFVGGSFNWSSSAIGDLDTRRRARNEENGVIIYGAPYLVQEMIDDFNVVYNHYPDSVICQPRSAESGISCWNRHDDNHNDDVDFDDRSCRLYSEVPWYNCEDGLDNDEDGLADHLDDDCFFQYRVCEPEPPLPPQFPNDGALELIDELVRIHWEIPYFTREDEFGNAWRIPEIYEYTIYAGYDPLDLETFKPLDTTFGASYDIPPLGDAETYYYYLTATSCVDFPQESYPSITVGWFDVLGCTLLPEGCPDPSPE